MRRGIGLSLIIAMGLSVSAQTINISGKVVTSNGSPIPGAIVKLSGKDISATTDANGKYKISTTAIVKSSPIIPVTEKISMVNGTVFLSLTKPAPVKFELYDMRGNLLVKESDNKASAGDYRFNLLSHSFAANMMVVRISVGNRSSTFSYNPLNSCKKTYIISQESSINNKTGKILKLNANVDSLKVSADLYYTKAVSVSSYESEINITLDSLPKFSFFVTSMAAIIELSKSDNGFGGDLRFGKTGPGAGLLGADSICQCIAEKSMPGSKSKIWRAFLSAKADKDGKQVDAIDRIGTGPWYDRTGRLLAPTIADLLNTRPMNGDPSIQSDLPNENGIPNHRPDPNGELVDNHHTITGSGTNGRLYSSSATCDDWTSTTASDKPRAGFSWIRGGGGGFGGGGGGFGGAEWISGWDAAGCEAGIHVKDDMSFGGKIIGDNGGYGGFYCFALHP